MSRQSLSSPYFSRYEPTTYDGRLLLGIGSGRQVGTQSLTRVIILRIFRHCCQTDPKLTLDVADQIYLLAEFRKTASALFC